MRTYYFGLGTAVIDALETTTSLAATAQKRFKVERILIESAATAAAAAGLSLVTNIVVGTSNQTYGNSETPLSMFAQNSTSTVLSGSVVTPGMDITISISRTTAPGAGNSETYSGGIVGRH